MSEGIRIRSVVNTWRPCLPCEVGRVAPHPRLRPLLRGDALGKKALVFLLHDLVALTRAPF